MQRERICTTDGASVRIRHCALSLSTEPWSFAERHRDAIAAYWRRVRAERPKMFDGTVHVLTAHALHDGLLTGTFARTDFKSFLYWREHGSQGPTRDGFGSSLVRSSDGCVLLGRQSEGHLNAGLAYPPSGLIDSSDTTAGRVDIDASIARELEEETGLTRADLERRPGYITTSIGPIVSIAIEWQSALPANALRERILAHVERQPEPELGDVVIVRSPADIDNPIIMPYAKAKLRLLLSA
jgi:8-oxo-dGTP pyrophosphatase MutT (NUDIX family)